MGANGSTSNQLNGVMLHDQDCLMRVKMIPPGIHFVYYSSIGLRERRMAPMSGFFHKFGRGEVSRTL